MIFPLLMRHQVYVTIRRTFKAFGAVRTGVGLVVAMSLHVLAQIAGPVEFLATQGTQIIQIPGMYAHVLLHSKFK